jgi:mevalonate kinase
LFWEIGSMCAMAREFVRAGSRAELGMCMERNQDILTAIGVSSPDVDRLVAAAKEAGAAGAKLSGAGRGGNVIALLGDDTDEATLTEALRDAGAAHVIGADLRPES